MSTLLAYSGIATKIRAMKSRLLTDDEYQELAGFHSVSEIAGYLKNKPGYEKILHDVNEQEVHRGELEKLISSASYRDFDALFCFANASQRKFLRIYAERFEIKLLKSCMTDIFAYGSIQDSSLVYKGFFDKHASFQVEALRGIKEMKDLIEALKDTIFYRPLHLIEQSERHELRDYEQALDMFHFTRLWKEKKKYLDRKDCALLQKEFGTKFDMLNLNFIFRAKHYYRLNSFEIYSLIIPLNYRIKKSDIKKFVEAEDMKAFDQLLKETYYGKRYEELSTSTLEVMYREILKRTLLKDARTNPYSMSILYSYIYHKEHEISRLIVTIESVRYRVDAQRTMEHVRRT